jgi:TolB-like protein
MISHTEAGNVSAALRLYQDFSKHLEVQFGAVPSEETRELAERIRNGEGISSAPGRGAGFDRAQALRTVARLPRIELTPIVSQQIDEEQRYLLEGFRRDLLTCLIRCRDWVIIESSTDPAESSSDGDSPDYRVDSYCAESHSNVELTVTLINLRDNRYIWSEAYTMELKSWLAAQRDIVRKVAAALGIYLSAERVSGRSRDQDISLEAYDDWLRGEELGSRWNPGNYEKAERLFKSVMARMPNFAPGYSSLAGLYNTWHIALPGVERDKKREARAFQLARQAVEIDPLDTRAQLTLAWSCAMAARFEKAKFHYMLAYDLNPNNPRTLISCAQGLAFAGDTEHALDLAAQAQTLSPFLTQYQWAYLSAVRFTCEDYAGCADAADWAGHAILDMAGWKTAALSLDDRIEDARAAARLFVDVVRNEWVGDSSCTDEAVVAWFLESLPVKNRKVTDNLRNGLKLAGLPA